MTRTALLLFALSLASPPVLANRGTTRKEDSWLQRGVTKAKARRGYGKLRMGRERPHLELGKMKVQKGAKWQSSGGVVLNPGSKKVLLVRARKEVRDGHSGWTWPKGRMNPGEKAARAAIRETLEESGVQALPVAKISQLRSSKALRHYYLMTKKKDTGKFDSREIVEVRWVSLKAAGKLLDRKLDRKVLVAARTTIRELEKAAALP